MQAKKSLGQHFLHAPHVIEKIVQAASIIERDTVLEVGPGKGVLTQALLARAGTVLAIEKDEHLAALLEREYVDAIKSGRLRLVAGDILGADLDTHGLKSGNFKIVANIPYYITGLIFRKLLGGTTLPNTAVFLVQKEVAGRIARDKKESLLSLSIKAYGTPKYVATVPRNCFSPQPGVDSAILQVTAISRENFKHIDESFFFELLHLGFGKRRKMLLGNLSACFPREQLAAIFEQLTIPQTIRAEDLSLSSWIKLTGALARIERHT